jgi:hypothetical protein
MTAASSPPNMPAPSPVSISGSCLCKAVQYTLTGNDKGAVLCHCRNCQKTTGSAFANNLRYTRANLTLTTGADVIKAYEDSDTNEKFKGLVILYSGGVEGAAPHTKPSGELFTHKRREWFAGVENAAKL